MGLKLWACARPQTRPRGNPRGQAVFREKGNEELRARREGQGPDSASAPGPGDRCRRGWLARDEESDEEPGRKGEGEPRKGPRVYSMCLPPDIPSVRQDYATKSSKVAGTRSSNYLEDDSPFKCIACPWKYQLEPGCPTLLLPHIKSICFFLPHKRRLHTKQVFNYSVAVMKNLTNKYKTCCSPPV